MKLSQREKNILKYIAKGFVDKEISAALSISEHTVHSHIHSILCKLNARTRAHAVAISYQEILKLKMKAG